MTVIDRLVEGWRRGRAHLWLALVPLFTGLLAFEKIQRVVSFRGSHVSVRTTLPAGILDVWSFVGTPGGTTVGATLPTSATGLLVAVVLVVVRAALSAGYFGSIADLVTGETVDFEANVGHYFLRFLTYEIAATVVTLLLFAPLLAVVGAGGRGGAALLLVAIPVVLVLSYLFYATPYVMVLRDTGLLDAAGVAYGLAVEGGAFFRYSAGFALVVLVASPLSSVVVVTLSSLGVLVGLAAGAVAGLVGNVATTLMVADVDPEAPPVERSPEPGDDAPDTTGPAASGSGD